MPSPDKEQTKRERRIANIGNNLSMLRQEQGDEYDNKAEIERLQAELRQLEAQQHETRRDTTRAGTRGAGARDAGTHIL